MATKAVYTNALPKINFERVACLEQAIEDAAVEIGCTINEAGIAFTQYVIHQTKLAVERGDA